MKIALAQMKMEEDIEVNYKKSLDFIRKASSKGANLIFFPEIQLNRFFPQYSNLNKDDFFITMDSKYIAGICEKCRKNNIYAVPNFYIKENDNEYDMCLFIDNNGKIMVIKKWFILLNLNISMSKIITFPQKRVLIFLILNLAKLVL
ncbi:MULTISPECIES: nitrilase-related carbon-nitrogen hydrolase [Methanobrevibacter]|uniref:nitrilase-related carbon-nitrogen hydrolase n=1 Tax=Methanobrevibacter TaxID=2172 RepID=UPI000F50E965|nr:MULTISPECIES: nitrilase-related carbon-nitrogen hydrolase [Methanobrevibacter]